MSGEAISHFSVDDNAKVGAVFTSKFGAIIKTKPIFGDEPPPSYEEEMKRDIVTRNFGSKYEMSYSMASVFDTMAE